MFRRAIACCAAVTAICWAFAEWVASDESATDRTS